MASCCQGGSSHTYTTKTVRQLRQTEQMQTSCKLLALVVEEGSNIKITGKTADPDLRLMVADRCTCGLSAWMRALCQNANAQPLRCCRYTQVSIQVVTLGFLCSMQGKDYLRGPSRHASCKQTLTSGCCGSSLQGCSNRRRAVAHCSPCQTGPCACNSASG